MLVTGAAGFTGRHFMAAARSAGYDPVPLQSNLRDADALDKEITALDPEVVVHLAAISFVNEAGALAYYDVNLLGSLNLLQPLKKCTRLRKVLLASTGNLYGNSMQSPLAETHAPAPVNHYAASKLAMEHMCRAQGGDLPLVVARPFNYTGVGQPTNFLVPKLVDHFLRKAPVIKLGNMHVEREYNDVRYVCDAYLRLLAPSAALGTYNVCTGVTHSLQDLLAKLEGLTGHRPEPQTDPALVRANEIHSLCGDPSMLQAAIGTGCRYAIEDTLSWMVGQSVA
jgi:nucleoside-diphosphate-sugar epimerase